MPDPQHRPRPSRTVIRRRRIAAAIAGAVAILAVTVIVTLTWSAPAGPTSPATAGGGAGEGAAPSERPEPPALTEAQQLILESGDPDACVVTFSGEGITEKPQIQHGGALFDRLPIPSREGAVFAGWYANEADAATLSIPGRVNGSKIVECPEQEIPLVAAWVTPEQNIAEDAGIPILMYHQFTTKPEGEEGWLKLNYIYSDDFDAQMAYIKDSGFYLPTWDELSAFIDGRLFLPSHSVIITDDDADQTWFDLGAPIVDKYELLATSFMVTVWRSDPPPNPYVLRRSHTNDMHRAGANGDGLIVNLPHDEIVADLEQSVRMLGVAEVLAYPFGHYNDAAKQAVADAGFEMARTIEQGYVRIGTDKLALPCIRINYGMGVQALAGLIG